MNQMPIARRKPHRPRYSDDDDNVLRDGETFHARVTMMDALQRSLYMQQQPTQDAVGYQDGSAMRKQAWLDRQERIANAWKTPDAQFNRSPASTSSSFSPPLPTPRWIDVDNTPARDAAYQARSKRLAEAWRT